MYVTGFFSFPITPPSTSPHPGPYSILYPDSLKLTSQGRDLQPKARKKQAFFSLGRNWERWAFIKCLLLVRLCALIRRLINYYNGVDY